MSYDYSQGQQPQYEDDYAEIDSLITQEDWSAFHQLSCSPLLRR